MLEEEKSSVLINVWFIYLLFFNSDWLTEKRRKKTCKTRTYIIH